MAGPHISHIVHPMDSFNQEGVCARCEQSGAALYEVCPGVPPVRQIPFRFPQRFELTPGEVDLLLDALMSYSEGYRMRMAGPMAEAQRFRIMDRMQKISDIHNKLAT
jgi:hypothetical protein